MVPSKVIVNDHREVIAALNLMDEKSRTSAKRIIGFADDLKRRSYGI